jgi:AraC-like DNA-binding protein
MSTVWINDRIYAAYKIVALVEALKALGLPGEQCLEGTGLDVTEVYASETRSSVAQYFTACRNAMAMSANPELAFLVGRRLHLSAYGMYGYALLCSPSIREAMNTAARFHRLATPTVAQQWSEDNGAAVWRFSKLPMAFIDDALGRFLLEQQLAQHVTQIHDLVGSHTYLQQIRIPYPASDNADYYRAHLQCAVLFDQPRCELHVDAAILDKSPILANRLTSNLLQVTCQRLIGKSKFATGMTGRVYHLLTQTPGQFPGMEEIADRLHVTSRTLRRRLLQEDTSFSDILDDVRRSFATEYLRTTSMSIESIALLVGFTDVSNFRAAFRKWIGQSPTEYRKQWCDLAPPDDERRGGVDW